jgi:Na+-driven multidrug efflux pump
MLLFIGTSLLSLSYGSASALVALGAPGFATIGWSVAVLVTVALEFPFARAFGITGAAVVSVISYGLAALVHLVLLRRRGVRELQPRISDGLVRRGRNGHRPAPREDA